jgi:hypothetical protein
MPRKSDALSESESTERLKRRRAIWQASSPGKQALQTSGLTL